MVSVWFMSWVILLLGHRFHHDFGTNPMHMKLIIYLSHVVLFFCVVVLGKLSWNAFGINTDLSNVVQMTDSQVKTKTCHRLSYRVSYPKTQRFVIIYYVFQNRMTCYVETKDVSAAHSSCYMKE